jgi:phosphoesterase RecJ-like protein
MRILLDGKYSLMVVTQEMVDTCGASFEITEGFVSHTIELAGVVVGIFAKVKPEGVRLSIRTRAGVSAIAIATQFGGGGHFYAAGGSMPPTSLPDIEQALLHAVQSVLASDNY